MRIKIFFLLKALIIISVISAHSQKLELFSKLSYLNFNFANFRYKNFDDYQVANNFTLIKYLVGLNYINKNNTEVSFSIGYYRSEADKKESVTSVLNNVAYTHFDKYTYRKFRYFNSNLSLGKRFIHYNKILTASLNLPFEITTNRLTRNTEHQENDITGKAFFFSEERKSPSLISTGIYFNFCAYSRISGKVYGGLEIGTGVIYTISQGEYNYSLTQTDLISNTTTWKDQSINIKSTSYSLPIFANLGLRYSIFSN